MENPAILWLKSSSFISVVRTHKNTYTHKTKVNFWLHWSQQHFVIDFSRDKIPPLEVLKGFSCCSKANYISWARHCRQTQSNNRGWKSLGKPMSKTMKLSSSGLIRRRKGVSFCTVELAISVRVAFKFRVILPVFALFEVFTQCLPVLLRDWTLSEGKSKLPAGSQGPDEMYLPCALSFSTRW